MCVLLVEDEPVIREIMAESLQEAGFDVHDVSSGAEAIAAIGQTARHYTALVTDFHMPGGTTGLEVASAMRKAMPDLPVVIASGRPDALRASWTRQHGYALLRKPYLASELIALVRTLLSPTAAGTK